MLYRASVDLTFLTEDDCVAFINLIENIKNTVYKGESADGIPATKMAKYYQCNHDDNPPLRCGPSIADVNIDDINITKHKTSDGKITEYVEFNKSIKKV